MLISRVQCVTRWCRGRRVKRKRRKSGPESSLQQLVPQFAPICAMADFEEPSVAGFHHVYPDVAGCWLHYVQAIIKTVHLCLIWCRVVRSHECPPVLLGLALSSLANVRSRVFSRSKIITAVYSRLLAGKLYTQIIHFQDNRVNDSWKIT